MNLSDKRKAQMHTLEGITAAFIIIAAAFYATQSIAITPTSSSTASKQAQAELEQVGNDALSQAQANGNLKDALLDWKESQNAFNGTSGGAKYYRGTPPANGFGETVEGVFDSRGIAYNIDLHFPRPNTTGTSPGEQKYLENGDPTDNAVVASETVVLRDHDRVKTGETLNESDTYPIDGYSKSSDEYRRSYYNVVEVRMTLWRK
jgi:hypothetical protein